MAAIETSETKFDGLFAGTEVTAITAGVTVASGAGVLVRGTVLGVITASGKCVKVDSTKTDGSQSPKYVLSNDVDATSADVVAVAYKTGVFRKASLLFGGTDTITTHEAALRLLSIFVKEEY